MDISHSGLKSGEGTWLWLAKIITGALVITLLFVHFIVNHYTAPTGLLSYREVVVYLSNPWIALMESAFLVIVVAHALIGLRSIILDLKPPRMLLTAVNWVFSIVGVVSIIYGIWLIRTIVTRGVGG